MKLINIVGARPQFIKVGPILRAIEQYNCAHPSRAIREVLVHTGQHYDYEMSKLFFDELELKEPDYRLGVRSGTHASQTGEMLKRIEEVLVEEKPDLIMVYGDTNSTLAGSLAGTKMHIPVAHVEAGLRSYNKHMPEEINRVLTDHISTWLFCPTETAVRNLQREGITEGVYFVGDVMYDSLLYNIRLADQRSKILEQLDLKSKGYALATIHRAENADVQDHLKSIFFALEAIAANGLRVIGPLHPRTKKQLEMLQVKAEHVEVIEPVSYLDLLLLERHARVVLTDSGGIQKETHWLGVPCLTLREETEWPETVQAGSNILVGWEFARILNGVNLIRQRSVVEFVDGHSEASSRIIQILKEQKV